MKTIVCFALPFLILLTGCATITNTLSGDTKDEYDFRETQWGFSQQRVLLAEQDSRLYLKREDVLIYNSEIAGVPAYLVYTFKNNKLRAAGYITEKPVKNVQKITDMSVAQLGKPTEKLKQGMVWKTPDTVIYSHAYPSQVTLGTIRYEQISGGVFANIRHNITKARHGAVERWDAVWSYIDISFYEKHHKVGTDLSDLSFYEKVLIGAIKRNEIMNFSTRTGLSLSVPQNYINKGFIDIFE